MDPQAMAALLPILEGLMALGVPGILLGMAAIPALVITLMCYLAYRHQKQIDALLETYRADTQNLIRLFVEKHEEMLRDFSEKHAEISNYYKNNVVLVQNHEHLNESYQTLAVNNTRALERLCVLVDTWSKNRGAA